MKTYVIPEYLVERDQNRCIRCKVCVNQCTYETHSYDQGNRHDLQQRRKLC